MYTGVTDVLEMCIVLSDDNIFSKIAKFHLFVFVLLLFFVKEMFTINDFTYGLQNSFGKYKTNKQTKFAFKLP